MCSLVKCFQKLTTHTLQVCAQRSMCQATCGDNRRKGLVIGIYEMPDMPGEQASPGKLTPSGEKYNRHVKGRIRHLMFMMMPPPKKGQVRIFYDLEPEYAAVALVGLGKECQGYDSFEQIDEGKEAIRIAAGTAVRAPQELPVVTFV